MTKSMNLLATAAVVGLACAAFTSNVSAKSGYEYQPTEGYFTNKDYGDECTFTHKGYTQYGVWVGITEKPYYGKTIVYATCKFELAYKSRKRVSISGYDCYYVDERGEEPYTSAQKGGYDDYDDQDTAYYSRYYVAKGSKWAYQTCKFKIDDSYGYGASK